jgi:hypothetical protein
MAYNLIKQQIIRLELLNIKNRISIHLKKWKKYPKLFFL